MSSRWKGGWRSRDRGMACMVDDSIGVNRMDALYRYASVQSQG